MFSPPNFLMTFSRRAFLRELEIERGKDHQTCRTKREIIDDTKKKKTEAIETGPLICKARLECAV